MHETKFDEISELVERILPLNSWGFQLSACLVANSYPIVIYDSKWCRLQFQWDRGDAYTGEILMIYYGRLHAVSDKFTMIWNGEEYNCWHHANEFLLFLDDLSPLEASQRNWSHFIEQFAFSEKIKNIPSQPQRELMMHDAIWNHYDKRVFELFDFRRPDLWKKYSDFLKEYYRIKGSGLIPNNPPLYKVC
jgi:hypothetical protein